MRGHYGARETTVEAIVQRLMLRHGCGRGEAMRATAQFADPFEENADFYLELGHQAEVERERCR